MIFRDFATRITKVRDIGDSVLAFSFTADTVKKRNWQRLKAKSCNIITLLLIVFCTKSCYTFKSAAIPAGVNTFYIEDFDNKARNALPIIGQIFTDRLRNKILNESRLTYEETTPDVEFRGEIVGYRISSVAPEEGAVAAFNRLEITVKVIYKNNTDAKDEWTQNFSFFENYDRNSNINDIQEDLIDTINDQIVEDIFNKAFSSWN